MGQERYSTLDLRVRAVLAVERGQPPGQVAAAYGVNRTTLFRWLRRFTTEGACGLGRRPGSGRPRLLAAFDLEALNAIILEHYGVTVSPDTVWRRWRDAGFTYQKPERRYFEVNEEARQAWLQNEAPQIRAAVREFRALLYF